VSKTKLIRINYQTFKTTRVLHPTTTRNNLPTTTNMDKIISRHLASTPTNDQFTLCLEFLKQDANYYHCK